MGDRGVRLALRCYPTWWRQKYGKEVEVHAIDMVADGHSPIGLTQSLLWGAVRLRTTAHGMPKDYGLWARRTSLSIATAVVPLLVAVPIMGLSTGGIRIALSRSGETPLVRDLNWVGLAMLVLLLTTSAVLVVGWVGLRGGLRRTAAPAKLRALMWVPFLAAIADVALSMPFVKINHWGPLNGHPSLAQQLTTTLTIVFWSSLILSIVSIVVVAHRSRLPGADLARGSKVATASAVLLAGNLASYCLWGTVMFLHTHSAGHGAYAWSSSSRLDLWAPTVVLLAIGLLLSVCSARIASTSRKVLATTAP